MINEGHRLFNEGHDIEIERLGNWQTQNFEYYRSSNTHGLRVLALGEDIEIESLGNWQPRNYAYDTNGFGNTNAFRVLALGEDIMVNPQDGVLDV